MQGQEESGQQEARESGRCDHTGRGVTRGLDTRLFVVPAAAAVFLVVLVLVIVVLVVVFFVVVVTVVVEIFFVVVEVIVFVVFRGDVEFNRRECRDFEVGAALRTAQLIAFVDVEFVHFDVGIALGTGGHTLLGGALVLRCGLAIVGMTCQNPPGRQAR